MEQRLHAQSRSPFLTELAVEDNDRLLAWVSTGGGFGLLQIGVQEVLFDSTGGVDIHGTIDVSTNKLVFEAAINEIIVGDARIVSTIQKIVNLQSILMSTLDKGDQLVQYSRCPK